MGVLAGLAVFVRVRFRVVPPTPMTLVVPPAEAIDRATGYMVRRGFTVSHAGRSSATFARKRRPNAAVGVLLLLLGLLPGLLYFALFRGTQTTTVATARTQDGPALVVSGADPWARQELERWARENVTTA